MAAAQSRFRRDLAILAVVPVLAFASYALFSGTVFSVVHSAASMANADSVGYMYFGEDRPVGYPLFLALIKWLTGSVTNVRLPQLALYCASLALLAMSFHARMESLVGSLALEGLLFGNPGGFMQADHIMSDCL